MVNFTFHNPTRIEFGAEKEKQIGSFMAADGVKKALLIYGSERIKKNGLFDCVTESLRKNNIEIVEFGGIVSNPLLSKVYEGIKVAKESKVDAVLSVGGGSVLDSAKSIAAGALYEGDIWDFFTWKRLIQKVLPIYDIITLAATGSEMNATAVLTNEATKQKLFISSPYIYPKVSIINPELQKSVSKDYLVYSASDVIAHSIEGYFTASYHPDIIASYIETNIKTIMKTTEVLIKNPNDNNARAEFAWAATQALNGTTYIGVDGVSYPNHMIEHALSALYNVAHGAGLSVIMPAWMKWYMSQNEKQFARFSQNIFGKMSPKEGIESLEKWFESIGTPTHLSQFSIKESDIDAIVENAYENAKAFGMSEVYTKDVLKVILLLAL